MQYSPGPSPSSSFAAERQMGPVPVIPVSATEPSPYNVGRSDLDPAGAFVEPSSRVGPFHIPGSVGSGSLVGPGHPMFADPNFPPSFGDEGQFPGYGNIPGLPEPRFDPYGPITGPHGPDVGNIGVGRGSRVRQPGEPDPDHLPPPGVNFGPGSNNNNPRSSGFGRFV